MKKTFLYKIVKSEIDLEYRTNVFSNPWLSFILMVIFCTTDFLCVFQVFNAIMPDSVLIIMITSLSFSAGLDISMYLAGSQLTNFKEIKSKVDVILLIGTFILFFVLYVVLRIFNIDILFNTGMSISGSNLDTSISASQYVVNACLSFIPFATSILSFLVGLAAAKDNKKLILKKKILDCVLLQEKLNELELSNYELEKDLEKDFLGYDRKLLEAEKKSVCLSRQFFKWKSKLTVANKLKSQEIVDILDSKKEENHNV